jgi:uncharacterized protein (TIGR00645 family)
VGAGGPVGRRSGLVETSLAAGRWLLVPFYAGLLLAILWLLVVFLWTFWQGLGSALSAADVSGPLLWILRLVELALVANLVATVALSSFGSLVARRHGNDPVDGSTPPGYGDESRLKPRLFSSIAAVAAIQLLEMDLRLDRFSARSIGWSLGILLAFVLTGLGVSWMDHAHRRGGS